MRKVTLIMDENQKYEAIKKLIETNGNKKRAALSLAVTATVLKFIKKLIKHINVY